MAEVPEEDLVTAQDETQPGLFPIQPAGDQDRIHRDILEQVIVNNISETPDFDALDNGAKARILLLKNDRDENVLLSAIRNQNVLFCSKMCDLLSHLELRTVIDESYDMENNNALQLATKHFNREIFDFEFEHVKSLGKHKLTSAILHRNHADENCMPIALSIRSQAPQSVAAKFENVIIFNRANIKSIMEQDNHGLNTIMHADHVKQLQLAKYLLAHVKEHCGRRATEKLLIGEDYSMTSDSGNNVVSGNEAGYNGETVFKRLLNIRNGNGLTADVDDILGDFLLFTITGDEQYDLLISKLPYSNQSILSHLIEHNCLGLIDKLQNSWEYERQEVEGKLAKLLHYAIVLGYP